MGWRGRLWSVTRWIPLDSALTPDAAASEHPSPPAWLQQKQTRALVRWLVNLLSHLAGDGWLARRPAKEEDGTDKIIKTYDGEAVFEEKVRLFLREKVVTDNCWSAIYWIYWIIVKKLSEQCPLKLKQNSVIEASNSEVEASWRGAEAVEASHTLHMGSNRVVLSGKLHRF